MATTYPANGRRVSIIASYCGDDDPNCSNSRPCGDCLAMCNVAIAEGTLNVLGGLDYVAELAAAEAPSQNSKDL